MKALCLKDYGTDQTNYATLVENGIKTLETRTWATKYRGDLLITCSASSKSANAGKAVCIVTLSHCEEMKHEHEEKACIQVYPRAKVWHLTNLRLLSQKFPVKSKLSLFEVDIPEGITEVLTETPKVLVPYEYGAVSSKFRLMAPNKLTAYATMVTHYHRGAHLVVIYSPETAKEDSWISITGQLIERLDEIFGGEGTFDAYLKAHHEKIVTCYNTIERIV